MSVNEKNIKIAENIKNEIKNANNILLIASKPSDQDSIGSAIVMKWYIKEKFSKESEAVIFSPITHRLDSLPRLGEVEIANTNNFDWEPYDLIICLDGQSFDRAVNKSHNYLMQEKNIVGIDHHSTGAFKEQIPDKFLQQHDSCTAKLIFDYFVKLDNLDTPPDIATIIYSALVDDTGRFKHEIYEDTFTFADELISLGADHLLATDENYSLEQIQFLSWAIKHTEFIESLETSLLIIGQKEKDELELSIGKNWSKDDIFRTYMETVMRKVTGYNYGIILQSDRREIGVRCGWRTRSLGGTVDLQSIFERIGFDAGGHFGAGGGFAEYLDINEARELFIVEMGKEIGNS
jgi:nanoRNase/pAp phosphatase (c-di-AMP/oligoRNAs hydrolase)